MRVGIFGGSFNPPHEMHRLIALNLIQDGYLDKVIYVPTGDLYQKSNLISARDRYQMLHLMTASNSHLEVSNYELKNHVIYTYQTLDYFKKTYPDDEIYFICGTDNLKELDTWKNSPYLLKNYKFIAIPRNHDNVEEILEKYLGETSIIIANIPYNPISSTEIRNMLKKDRTSKKLAKKLLPTTLEYIYQNNLYS